MSMREKKEKEDSREPHKLLTNLECRKAMRELERFLFCQNFLLCGSEFWVLSGFSFTTLCTKKENKPMDNIFTFIPKNPFT
jgi:hypothetical protein